MSIIPTIIATISNTKRTMSANYNAEDASYIERAKESNYNDLSFFGWLMETHSDEYNEFLAIYKKQYKVDTLSTTEVVLFLVWIKMTYPEKYNDLLKQYKK